MATDGPKIIDGDLAHDTYWAIMDMYDSGADTAAIAQKFPIEVEAHREHDDFEYEIYITVLALAFWEIGALNEALLDRVKHVIDQGVGVRFWTRECDEKEGKKRQRELDRLWGKISQPNTKIRKRKKYRTVTKLHFQEDDLLTFKLPDNNYCAVICARIEQYRGQCNYGLVATTYKSDRKPRPQDLDHYDIVGSWIGSGFDVPTMKQMQPGIERLWELFPDRANCFFGLSYDLVTHKDFYGFRDKFESVAPES